MASAISPHIYKCLDCPFTSESQRGISGHRKLHKATNNENVLSVYVVRIYPEGKKFQCCLCNTTISSFPNFKRHFKEKHPNIELISEAKCSLCGIEFKNAQAVSVHCLRKHQISKKKPNKRVPPSPTPIQSFISSVKHGSTVDFPPQHSPSNPTKSSDIQPPRCSPQIPTQISSQTRLQTTPQVIVQDHQLPSHPHIHSNPQSQEVTSTPQFLSPIYVESSTNTIPSYKNTCEPEMIDLEEDLEHSYKLPSRPIFRDPEHSRLSFDDSFKIPMTPDTSVALNGCTNEDGIDPIDNCPNLPNVYTYTSPSPSPSLHDNDAFITPTPIFHLHSVTSSVHPSSDNLPSSSLNELNSDQNATSIDDTVVINNTEFSTTDDPSSFDIPLSSNPDIENHSEFVRIWSSRFTSTESFAAFSYQCDQFARAVVDEAKVKLAKKPRSQPISRPNRPNNRPVSSNRPRVLPNPIEARRLQTLYRISKKRAARQVLNGNSTSYTGTKDQAEQYFSNTFTASTIDINEVVQSLNTHVPSVEMDDSIMSSMSCSDIKKKLRSMANSAPGKDRVEYQHLKAVDPNGKILSIIFNKCLNEKKIPSSWKESTTILIYKKGSSEDPSNFRPIALMSCIYKLFTSILSSRVTNCAIDHGLMSPQQKCARPAEGCHEHSFTLQSIISDCKRSQKNCFMAWLDLRNAFGSVTHEAIYLTLRHMGFPDSLVELIQDIYCDATTIVRTSRDEETGKINVNAGVKQGCPISPVLFNLTSELLIRSVLARSEENSDIPFVLHGQPISILAYADDLVIISRTREGLQTLLDDISASADVLKLSFRQDKCASLSLTLMTKYKDRVSEFIFQTQGLDIPYLKKEESYRYLGVPISLIYHATEMDPITDKLIADLEKIRDSLLAPWQKLDAIRTFIQPGLTYALRSCPVIRESLKQYRIKLIQVLKSICNLPNRASTAYFFADRSVGGLAFQDPFKERHIQTIVHTVKILSATDPLVKNIARGQLKSVVYRCINDNPSAEIIDDFLSGSKEGKLQDHSQSNNSQTLWSRCRIAASALKIKFKGALGEITISTDELSHAKARNVASYLHKYIQKSYAEILKSLPDQGKVARCLQSCHFYSANNWSFDGSGIRFCDWRFIHRARTNTLPTNHVKSRWSNTNPECRRCHSQVNTETLPHVICHCKPNMTMITARHDRVLKRLTNAIHSGEVTVDKIVPGAPGINRPDIVVREGNKVLIIDVTCPFENDVESLEVAAQRKVDKYNYLIDHFDRENKSAKVFGFVVGPLGAWYDGNDKVLDELMISKRYRTLFRKLCCADAIRGSRNIYVEHLTGVPQ